MQFSNFFQSSDMGAERSFFLNLSWDPTHFLLCRSVKMRDAFSRLPSPGAASHLPLPRHSACALLRHRWRTADPGTQDGASLFFEPASIPAVIADSLAMSTSSEPYGPNRPRNLEPRDDQKGRI